MAHRHVSRLACFAALIALTLASFAVKAALHAPVAQDALLRWVYRR